jgi:hypothetical protein
VEVFSKLESPLSEVGEDLVEQRVLVSEALGQGVNSSVLLHFVIEDGTNLSLLDLMLKSVGSALVVTVSHVFERSSSPLSFGLSKSVSKDIELDSLNLFLSVFSLVTLSVDVTRDIINFSLSLLNSGIKLHGVVSGVSQSLLEVGDLTGKFTLGRLVLSIFLFDLRLVLELDSFLLEDSTFHVLDHLLLLLAELVVHELHTMDFFTHSNNFRLTDLGVDFFLHFLLKLDLALPEEDLAFSLDDLSQDVGLLFLELRNLVLKLDALVFELLKLLFELVLDVEVIVSQSGLGRLVFGKDLVELTHF